MANKFSTWFSSHKWTICLSLLCVILLVSTITVSVLRFNCPNSRKARDLGSDGSYRLPRNVIPTNYKLRLEPMLRNKTFNGAVLISVKVVKPTSTIVLHSHETFKIHSITVKENGTPIKRIENHVKPDKNQFLHINLDRELTAGNYEISIKYSGRLDNGIVGFYESTLKKGGTMVASKFQPTYARQAFPCFDEPDFKATYDITLVKPAGYTALSNMNEISRIHDSKTNTDAVTFATSVPMSTYLACFVICDFEFKETNINTNGIGEKFELRSFAQKGETHKIDFAQDIGKRSTEFYINYYQVPFPLPKLDMIAIPDYVSGATEHWGLITYRETSFLVDESTASSRNKISVATTIAHELAHMWFGNLVTMKWWDEVWLNEGFATFMSMKALDAIEPSWTMLDQFLSSTLHSVLVTDAKLSSHPIVQTVDTPDQITAIFDAISYKKGSSILRMLEGFIGDENFRRGVTDYLNKHKYGNTITQDLLNSLEPYFNENNPTLDLTYIVDTWTRQMGYPVLTVQKSDKPNTYKITQSRFLLDPEAESKNDSPFNYRWFIPITFKTDQGKHDRIVWFSDKEQSVEITLEASAKWLKINNNQVGYYRVNYTNEDWQKLAEELKSGSGKLTISDRAHLLNDIFALAEARMASYELALNLTAFLKSEQDYVPWSVAVTIFNDLSSRLLNTQAHDDLKKYVRNLVKPLYEKQSWERSTHDVIDGLLRTKILSLATKFGLPEAEQKVRQMFLKYLNSGTDRPVSIEPELRNLVYYYGMKQASLAEWELLWQRYQDERDVQEQSKLRSALAAPADEAILKRYLTLAWDESKVRSQDYLSLLAAISRNPKGTALIWDHYRENWPKLVERFTLNSRYLGNVIVEITGDFDTEARLQEMESFFAKYPEAGAGEAARRRALETVRNNIKWAKHNKPAVAKWLAQQA